MGLDPRIRPQILEFLYLFLGSMVRWRVRGAHAQKGAKGSPYFRVLVVRKSAKCALAIAIRSPILSPPA